MPLISALAARRAFTGQRARSRGDDSREVVLSGEVVTGADGGFAGFRGTADTRGGEPEALVPARTSAFDHALDEALRSPLDRIIESAERIVERADGPLRSDYASYGNDIATAARHLLSVIRSMSEDPAQGHRTIDLGALAGEAVVMLESSAEERGVTIQFGAEEPLPASGRGARGDPDPGQSDQQCGSSLTRQGDVTSCLRADRGHGVGHRHRPGAGNRQRRPAADFRALRARSREGRRDRPRARHLAPAGAVDGRRRDPRKRSGRRRALHPHACPAPRQPYACRRARIRAAWRRRRAGAGGRSSARDRQSSRSTARPIPRFAPTQTAK